MSMKHLEDTLTGVVSAIHQTSDRRTRIFVKAVIGKLGGVAAVGGISSLVTTFGVASTGTAIASLSGAAATTAKLYWIGSLVGLGVAGGGVLLTVGGLGAYVAAGEWGRRKLIGRPRSEDEFQEHEKAILFACITLINAIRRERELDRTPSPTEMRLVAEHVLIPVVNQIDQYWNDASLEEKALSDWISGATRNQNGCSECRPFTRTLAYQHIRKLDRCRTELGGIARTMMAVNAAG